MIVSMIDGRMRIRDLKLKESAVAGELKRHLSALKGIKEVLINVRAGSALIIYDVSALSAKIILNSISKYLDLTLKTAIQKAKRVGVNPVREFSLSRVNTKRAVSIGLIASLVASLISLVFGSKTLHAAFGLVFLSFIAIHIFKYGKLLLA